MSFPADGVCFVCKGCGQPAFYFPTGVPGELPPGTIGHVKPAGSVARRDYGEPSAIKCVLYQQLNPLEFWELHKDAARLERPTSWVRANPGT